ncbi:MAG: SpoIID/LytB domain-containing protein [Myxococcaceae bacterium]|nr:SpoIID/LytB domain-containing protein [Myxococcaceae bacterium]
MVLAFALVVPLAAAPLEVRVLEREKPVALRLSAERVRCGARALSSPLELSVGRDGVTVPGQVEPCALVVAEGRVVVGVGALERRYPGTLSVSLEGGLLRLINTVDVETYLASVVHAELSGAPPSALEAQAIVSRTFALTGRHRHERAGYHLCDLTHCQWYRGLEDGQAAAEAAVAKTKGQVLMVGGIALKPAFFHASCGGHTSASADVFREAGAGPGVKDGTKKGPACRDAPDFEWSWQVDRVELARALNTKPEGDAFVPLSRDRGGRVLEVSAFGKRMDGGAFASRIGHAFGWQALKSLLVTAEEVEATVTFKGRGVGHGVGFCQHGAKALAAEGFDAKKLLARYFPDCQVRQAEE